jgi:hypothetical protein
MLKNMERHLLCRKGGVHVHMRPKAKPRVTHKEKSK